MPVAEVQPRITRLRLSDFRSYPSLDIGPDAPLVALCGPNGAGKTNILEAISLFTPGRGLRRAASAMIACRDGAGGYAVLADLMVATGPLLLATALPPNPIQRITAAEAY
ncbi:MAG TPA: AAA family ATPase, partial [Rhabdaerophilum sp.]|nr:AAA family ATPase [Rhabdaerophilum sp.]